MPHAGSPSHPTTKSDAASPTKRVTRSAFKTPPGQGTAPPRSPPGAPARPVRKLFLS
jgi:hypothetical protein